MPAKPIPPPLDAHPRSALWDVREESAPSNYVVAGKSATSYEYNVAKALDTINLPFIFQVSYLGGRTLRGGVVLDFLVLTDPLSTPCWVHGEHWHSGKQRTIDLMKQAVLDFYTRGELALPVVLYGELVDTEEKALATVRRVFLYGAYVPGIRGLV